jgi:hypothetical protein
MSWQGGFEYKKAIVNTIIDIVEENSDAKESGLSSLSLYTCPVHQVKLDQ